MKPIQNHKKLKLSKHTVSNLTNSEQARLIAGGAEEAVVTTSFGKCTGFTCCDPTESITITITVATQIFDCQKTV